MFHCCSACLVVVQYVSLLFSMFGCCSVRFTVVQYVFLYHTCCCLFDLQKSSDGVHFLYIRRNGLYFVAATKFNIAPAFALELLSRYLLQSALLSQKYMYIFTHAHTQDCGSVQRLLWYIE